MTEFSFPLSIHGAWMLEDGIMDYVETTMVMHEQGQEDDGYCAMRTATAVTEAKKLLVWAKQIDEEYLEGMIDSLHELISNEVRPAKSSSLKACSLPKGNATEFSFPLSIHGAWMLEKGIAIYAKWTTEMYECSAEEIGRAHV